MIDMQGEVVVVVFIRKRAMPATSYPQRPSSAQFVCRSDIFVAIDMQGEVAVVVFIRKRAMPATS